MFHEPIETTNAEPVDLVEAEIVAGLSQCKSVEEIAAGIVALLRDQIPAGTPAH